MAKNISRRGFLKTASLASLGLIATACSSENTKPEHHAKKKGEMTHRVNHNTGDSVSVLGYGCMRLPTVEGESAQKSNGEINQEEVNRQVDYAMAAGVNYYDTSPAYCRGLSETVMGKALSRYPRESYYIATKLSNFAPETWSHDRSVEMFETSLRNLQTDYIDYYLLHCVGIGSFENLHGRFLDNGMLDFCKQMREQGKIRNLGFSYHGDVECFDEMLRMHDRGDAHWDFVQIQLNYINWEHPAEENERHITAKYLYDELAKRNIPVVIMEPLLGGALANVPKPVATKMKQRRPDESIPSWAFRFAAQPGVLTVLSGMTYMEHIKDNVATFSPLEPVSDEEQEFLLRMATEIVENNTVPCTACAYCMPCPYGIDIPAIFAHFNKCINDDNVLHDKRDPRYAEARRAFLVGYDRAVSPLRQADQCVGCGACVSHCPQTIAIPDQLARINHYVENLKQSIPTREEV